jgi:hypothetical protein
MTKKLDPIENAAFQPRCNVVLRPVHADFRELPVHAATSSEFT